MISCTTGEPLGSLEAGLAAALTGSARVSIASGGIACVAAAALITVALPGLWRYDARSQPVLYRAGGSAPAVEPGPEPELHPGRVVGGPALDLDPVGQKEGVEPLGRTGLYR